MSSTRLSQDSNFSPTRTGEVTEGFNDLKIAVSRGIVQDEEEFFVPLEERAQLGLELLQTTLLLVRGGVAFGAAGAQERVVLLEREGKDQRQFSYSFEQTREKHTKMYALTNCSKTFLRRPSSVVNLPPRAKLPISKSRSGSFRKQFSDCSKENKTPVVTFDSHSAAPINHSRGLQFHLKPGEWFAIWSQPQYLSLSIAVAQYPRRPRP